MTDTSSPSAPSVYHEEGSEVDLTPYDAADRSPEAWAWIEQYRNYRTYDEAVIAANPLGTVYEIVLLTPDLAQCCRFGRDDPGLKLFQDGIYAADVASLAQACRIIREWTGQFVELTEERHGELTRWTVSPAHDI